MDFAKQTGTASGSGLDREMLEDYCVFIARTFSRTAPCESVGDFLSSSMQKSTIKQALLLASLLIVFVLLVWSSDQITLQGERTIFTVACKDGAWDGVRCTGTLVAGDRYRYRASRSRQEVIFWVVGSNRPSGKYSDCVVKDRGNWSCNATLQSAPPSITQEMVNDRAMRGAGGLTVPFHAVPKWKWWLLREGIRIFHDAAYD